METPTPEPRTIARYGRLDSDLLQEIRKYDQGFVSVSDFDSQKFGLYVPEHPSFIMIARPYGFRSDNGKRVLTMITSYSDLVNRDVLKALNQVTAINAVHDADDDSLLPVRALMSIILEQLVMNGPEYMHELKKWI